MHNPFSGTSGDHPYKTLSNSRIQKEHGMNNDDKSKLLEELSDVAINSLKKAVSEGKKPTRESLLTILSNMPETHAFLDKSMGLPSGKQKEDDDIERLKSRNEKLVRQLDGLEENFERNDRLSKRIMVFLAEWVRTHAHEAIEEPITQFKQILKDRSDPALLEEAFNTLKNLVMNGELARGENDSKPKKSFMARLISKESAADTQERHIEQFRSTYRDIINELGLDLGVDFLPRLLQLGKQINTSATVDDFSDLRKDILSLLHDYIESVTKDREKTAEFIRDIGRKLVEVETDLIRTFGLTEDFFSENTLFSNTMMEELSDLENSVGYSSKIEELKEVVNSKLAHIKSAVMKKKENDGKMKSGFDEDVVALKAEFEGLKKEAIAAKAQTEKLEKEIFTDPLTGAMNRRAYERRIRDEYSRFIRYKRIFSMLLFDVDHFKKINDTYGHATGDTALKEIIKRVAPMIRDIDMLARYGGEEFVIILPETDKSGASDVGEKVRKTIENIEFIHREEKLHITVSVGVTEVSPSDKTPMDMFNRLDTAMYEAKKSGRNRVIAR